MVPLLLYIQGSDPSSHFFTEDGGRILGYDQDVLMEALRDRAACVLVVEKPQTFFLWRSRVAGTVRGTSQAYKRACTADRWLAALKAAVEGVWTLPQINVRQTLVIGHSEGSQVAAELGSLLPQISAVACLAGSDFTPGIDAPTAAECAHPNALKLNRGHTLKYWRSWQGRSMSKALLASGARVYLAHGRNDPCSNFAAFERTVSELKSAGRGDDTLTVDVGDYDHGLDLPGQSARQGMQGMFAKILDWTGFWTKPAQ
jgi:pimeloyl-ACP methyl ester carboxylesterase